MSWQIMLMTSCQLQCLLINTMLIEKTMKRDIHSGRVQIKPSTSRTAFKMQPIVTPGPWSTALLDALNGSITSS